MVSTSATGKVSKVDNSQRCAVSETIGGNPLQHILANIDDRIHNKKWFTARGLDQLSSATGQSPDVLAKVIAAVLALFVLVSHYAHFVANAILIAIPATLVFVFPNEAPPSGQLYVYWTSFGVLTLFDRGLEAIPGYYIVKAAILYLLFIDPYRLAQVIYVQISLRVGHDVKMSEEQKGAAPSHYGKASQLSSITRTGSRRTSSQRSSSIALTDKSAGFVLVRHSSGKPEYLLLKSSSDGKWMPLSGPQSKRESEWGAATRNVKALTGIESSKLTVTKECNDVVIGVAPEPLSTRYWLAETEEPLEAVLTSQHSAAQWFEYTEAHEKVDDSLKPLLAKFNENLTLKRQAARLQKSRSASTRTAPLASASLINETATAKTGEFEEAQQPASIRKSQSASTRTAPFASPSLIKETASTRTAILKDEPQQTVSARKSKSRSVRTALPTEPGTPSTRSAVGGPPSTRTGIPAEASTRTAIPAETSTRTAIPAEKSSRTAIPAEASTRTAIPAEASTRTALPAEASTRTAVAVEQTPSQRRGLFGMLFGSNTASTRTAVADAPASTRTAIPSEPSTRTALPAEPSTRTAIPSEPSTRTAIPAEASTTTASAAVSEESKSTTVEGGVARAQNIETTTATATEEKDGVVKKTVTTTTTTTTTETDGVVTGQKTETDRKESIRKAVKKRSTPSQRDTRRSVRKVAEARFVGGSAQESDLKTAQIGSPRYQKSTRTALPKDPDSDEKTSRDASSKRSLKKKPSRSSMTTFGSAQESDLKTAQIGSPRYQKSTRTAIPESDEKTSRDASSKRSLKKKPSRSSMTTLGSSQESDLKTAQVGSPRYQKSTRTALPKDPDSDEKTSRDASSKRSLKKKPSRSSMTTFGSAQESDLKTAQIGSPRYQKSTRTALPTGPDSDEKTSRDASSKRSLKKKPSRSSMTTFGSAQESDIKTAQVGSPRYQKRTRTALPADPNPVPADHASEPASTRTCVADAPADGGAAADGAAATKTTDTSSATVTEQTGQAGAEQTGQAVTATSQSNEAPGVTPNPVAFTPGRMDRARRNESSTDIGGGSQRQRVGANVMETNAAAYSLSAAGEGEGTTNKDIGPLNNLHDLAFLPMNCLVFNAPFDFDHLTYHMRLTNTSHHRLAFAVKGNCIPRVTVYPPSGIMASKQQLVVAVTVRKFEWNESDFEKDRIVFEYILMKKSQADIKEFDFKLLQDCDSKRRKNIAIQYNP